MTLSVINNLFLRLLSLSVSAALVGMLILLIHPLTERLFSRKWNYCIWFLVMIRLLLPVQLPAVLPGGISFDIATETAEKMPEESSITDSRGTVAEVGEMDGIHSVEAAGEPDGIQSVEAAGEPDGIQSVEAVGEPDDMHSAGAAGEMNGIQSGEADRDAAADAAGRKAERISRVSAFLMAAEIIWIFGVIAALGMKLWNYRRFVLLLKRDAYPVCDDQVKIFVQSVTARLHLRETPPVYESASISGPVTVGLWKPIIILPKMKCGLTGQNQPGENQQELSRAVWRQSMQYQLIFHHELIHVARHDLQYKWLYQLLLCIHWFNPFLYLFERKMNLDCELSCDEAVLAELTPEGRKAYGNVLLDIAEQNTSFETSAFATTFVKGESGLKKRLTSILTFKRTTVLRLLFSICAMAGAMFLTACGGISISFDDGSFDETYNRKASGDSVWAGVSADGEGEAYQVYDDAQMLAGEDLSDKWQAYSYVGGGERVTISRFVLNGSSSIRIIYATEDTDIGITSSFDLQKGRFKVVHVAPDGSVETINDTGEKSDRIVTLQEGRNVIKIVGQEAKLEDVEIRFSGLEGKNREVYNSEEDEYAGKIMEAARNGSVEKEKFMECLYYVDEKDISEVFAVLLGQGEVFSQDELTDIFIFSDAERSGQYLVEAMKEGLVEPPDVDTLSEIIYYMKGDVVVELLKALPLEDFPEALETCQYYLSEAELKECLNNYIDAGGTLSYQQLSDLEPYLSRDAIEKLYEKMALPAKAGEPE